MALRSLEKVLRATTSRRNLVSPSSRLQYQSQNSRSRRTASSVSGVGSRLIFMINPCGVRYSYIHGMT